MKLETVIFGEEIQGTLDVLPIVVHDPGSAWI